MFGFSIFVKHNYDKSKKEQYFYLEVDCMSIFCDIRSNASWKINNVEHKKK